MGLEGLQGSPERRNAWAELLAVRSQVAKILEGMRNDGKIGAALEAEVTIHGDFFPFADLLKQDPALAAEELHFFFITSVLDLAAAESKPEDAIEMKTDRVELWISARRSEAGKCVRCWHYRKDIGVDPGHPEICGRCVGNLPGGAGENRQFF